MQISLKFRPSIKKGSPLERYAIQPKQKVSKNAICTEGHGLNAAKIMASTNCLKLTKLV